MVVGDDMRIYGQEWKVVICTPEEMKSHAKETDELKEVWGLCSGIDNTIYLNNTMSADRKRKTLIHEIAHAITEEMGIKPFMNKTDSERIVEFMAAHYDEMGKILSEVNDESKSI